MTDIDFEEFSRGVVDEFRANAGKVGGMFEGAPLILVNNIGAKSGKAYTTPLVYRRDGEHYIVIGSKGGAPAHPHWYLNLLAHPDVTIEVGTQTIPVTARTAEGDERTRLWNEWVANIPNFEDYRKATEGIRELPVIVLQPR